MPTTLWRKDPDARLDWAFDWASDGWLDDGETISSYTVTAEAGITVDSDNEAAGIVTVWLSGGTVGVSYDVACRITTSDGRVDERTITIRVQDR